MYPHVHITTTRQQDFGFKLVLRRGLRREVLQHLKSRLPQKPQSFIKRDGIFFLKKWNKICLCFLHFIVCGDCWTTLCHALTNWKSNFEKKTRTQSPDFSVPFNLYSLYSFYIHTQELYFLMPMYKGTILFGTRQLLNMKQCHQSSRFESGWQCWP